MKFYPNGLGESLGGDALATQKPIVTSGNVWWVNSATGVDAASPAGQDREKPLASLGQANTNAVDGDIIVLESGHTETLVAVLTLKGVTVVGIGTTSGKPAAQLKINSAGACCVQFASTAGELRNIYFPASVQSNTNTNGKVRFTTTNCVAYGLYIECSALDQLPALSIDSNSCRIENCTIVSTATTVATRPLRGLYTTGAVSDLTLVGNVFDDGSVGFANPSCDLSTGTITRLRGHSNSLLRGAGVSIASASTGYFIASTQTGGARVNW